MYPAGHMEYFYYLIKVILLYILENLEVIKSLLDKETFRYFNCGME